MFESHHPDSSFRASFPTLLDTEDARCRRVCRPRYAGWPRGSWVQRQANRALRWMEAWSGGDAYAYCFRVQLRSLHLGARTLTRKNGCSDEQRPAHYPPVQWAVVDHGNRASSWKQRQIRSPDYARWARVQMRRDGWVEALPSKKAEHRRSGCAGSGARPPRRTWRRSARGWSGGTAPWCGDPSGRAPLARRGCRLTAPPTWRTCGGGRGA